MSVESKGVKSFRKKDLPGQLGGALGLTKIVFAHKATAGDTGFNLLSLVLPSELSLNGFVQPSTQVLAGTSLLRYKNNFTLLSSLTGTLIPFQSYTIGSAYQVNFVGFTAADGEIFYGIVDSAQAGQMNVVSGNPLVVTGLLAQGQTDFAVGAPFLTNQYPLAQIGAVSVFRKGVLQARNTNNATAGVSADGNYQEVPTVGQTGNVIRFNMPAVSPLGDPIIVISNGLLVNNPTDSMLALIESLQGQISAIVPVLAAAAGVSQSSLGGVPSSVDLRAFGNQVAQIGSAAWYQEVFLPSQFQLSSASNTYSDVPGMTLSLPAGTWDLRVEGSGHIFNGGTPGSTYGQVIISDSANNLLGTVATIATNTIQNNTFDVIPYSISANNLVLTAATTFKVRARMQTSSGSPLFTLYASAGIGMFTGVEVNQKFFARRVK